MTKGQRNKLHLSEALEVRFNLQQDRWGHYKFQFKGYTMRLKFQKQSVRLEALMPAAKQWRRIVTVPAGRVCIDNFTLWLNDPSFSSKV